MHVGTEDRKVDARRAERLALRKGFKRVFARLGIGGVNRERITAVGDAELLRPQHPTARCKDTVDTANIDATGEQVGLHVGVKIRRAGNRDGAGLFGVGCCWKGAGRLLDWFGGFIGKNVKLTGNGPYNCSR